jgi:hypothetical protein
MSFEGEGMNEVLGVIRQECDTLGLKAMRSDDAVGSDFVMIKIGQMIEEAELIICDLTHERPNVYHELGYAHGVGNRGDRVLLVAREGTPRPFDIGGLQANSYSSPEALKVILQKNLREMLRLSRSQAPQSEPARGNGLRCDRAAVPLGADAVAYSCCIYFFR